jgi:zinc protease
MQEPAEAPGLAGFVASLLDKGTTSRNASQLANAIDAAGGLLTTGAGNDTTQISGAIIKDQVDLALSMVAEMAGRPDFPEPEIARQKAQAVSAIEVNADDPEYLADAVIERLIYGPHPYGRPGAGTAASIRQISRADVVAFHARWFAPNNALLAIVGDLEASDAFAAAERAFGAWPRKEIAELPAAAAPPPGRRVVVVDRPGTTHTEIRIGQPAVPRGHPDYLAFDMAVRILGGAGANRLFGVLRNQRGLAYDASADLRAFLSAGNVVVRTGTRTDATAQVLRVLIDEFARLRNEPVDPRELRGAQDYASGSFPLAIETSGAIAMAVLDQLFYGLNLKELDTYRDRVEALTVQEIQRVTRTWLNPDTLSIVLVGDAAAFSEQLKVYGFAEVERIPIDDLDLATPSLRRRAR